MDDLSREDVAQVIERLIAEVLSTAGVSAPPVDALAIAAHLGLTVEIDQAASVETNQWTAARAIGDHFKQELRAQLGTEHGSLSGLFATALLLPMQWFRKDVREFHCDVRKLKERYRTAAIETIAFRLLDPGDPCIITIADEEKVHRRRSNGPQVKKQLAKAEQECLRLVSESRESQVVRADGWTVQGWFAPIDGWRRVILRSVVEME
jgi:hypothetical protein